MQAYKRDNVLLRVRPSAHRIAKQLAVYEDVPMTVLVSDLIKKRWKYVQSNQNIKVSASNS